MLKAPPTPSGGCSRTIHSKNAETCAFAAACSACVEAVAASASRCELSTLGLRSRCSSYGDSRVVVWVVSVVGAAAAPGSEGQREHQQVDGTKSGGST